MREFVSINYKRMIGDVLTGGELAAAVVVDAVTRLLGSDKRCAGIAQ